MSFFLVKAAKEALAGDLSGAWKTITSGAPEDVQILEDDAATAFKAFLAVFGPAEAKTILTSLTVTVKNGVKAGETALISGTVADAETGAQAVVTSLENSTATPIQAAVAAAVASPAAAQTTTAATLEGSTSAPIDGSANVASVAVTPHT